MRGSGPFDDESVVLAKSESLKAADRAAANNLYRPGTRLLRSRNLIARWPRHDQRVGLKSSVDRIWQAV
jgi:hypothetical protein